MAADGLDRELEVSAINGRSGLAAMWSPGLRETGSSPTSAHCTTHKKLKWTANTLQTTNDKFQEISKAVGNTPQADFRSRLCGSVQSEPQRGEV